MFRLIKKVKAGGETIVSVHSECLETAADCLRVLIVREKDPPLSHVVNFGYEVEREENIAEDAIAAYKKRGN